MSTRMEGLRRRLRRAADRIQTESVDERQGRYARMSRQGKRVETRRLLSALAENHPVRVYGGHAPLGGGWADGRHADPGQRRPLTRSDLYLGVSANASSSDSPAATYVRSFQQPDSHNTP